jgi:hypothetical protein
MPRISPPLVPGLHGEIAREAAWASAPWYFCEGYFCEEYFCEEYFCEEISAP